MLSSVLMTCGLDVLMTCGLEIELRPERDSFLVAVRDAVGGDRRVEVRLDIVHEQTGIRIQDPLHHERPGIGFVGGNRSRRSRAETTGALGIVVVEITG